MYSLVFAVLAVSAYCHNAYCETTPTTEGFAPLQSTVAAEANKNENQVRVNSNSPRNFIWQRQELPRKGEGRNLEKGKRKSRILGSLAFLAGLGVGGLAGAASTGVKHLAKYPEALLTLNLGGPKVTPYFAQLYEPYAYVPHPYIYPPYALYPFLDPLRLQNSVGGVQSSLQHQVQSQLVNQVDDESQNETSDSDKYEQEDERVENENGEVVDDKKSNGQAELQAETDRNAEEKRKGITCNMQKMQDTTDNAVEDAEFDGDLQQEADGSNGITNRQIQQTTTRRPHHHRNTTAGSSTMHRNTTVQPTDYPEPTLPPLTPFPRPPYTPPPMTQTPPQTIPPFTESPPTTPPFPATTKSPYYGYYGGSPQEIDHVHLTSDSSIFQPTDYPPVNYNLPHDRPANFIPEEKLNYLINSNPSISPYYPHQWAGPVQEPEYYNNNYYKVINTPVNTQTFPSGFRPILQNL